ncbi:MAG TPA: hypothetical protein VJP76_05095 [Candidatus Tumulicola sp.]|nr:hypothetical protein [Candidatus Tumulicola sp.]
MHENLPHEHENGTVHVHDDAVPGHRHDHSHAHEHYDGTVHEHAHHHDGSDPDHQHEHRDDRSDAGRDVAP